MSKAMIEPLLGVRPLAGVIGADVGGVDLAALDDATFRAIEAAWLERLVLRFRDQDISDVDLMNFSRRFGALDRVPVKAAGQPETDDPRLAIAADARELVTVISNVKIDGKAIGGLGNYEAHWHTDMSYGEVPPMASVLFGIEVPPNGGNTSFANMYAAYESLDDETKQRIAYLCCVHDASRNSVGELRSGFQDVADPRLTKGAIHPIVRTHPTTRKKCLFLGRRRNAYIVGLPLEESEALLDVLWTHACRPELCWTQEWRKGDVVIWDNRCTMHRRDPFDNSYDRVMHRTQICGDKPC